MSDDIVVEHFIVPPLCNYCAASEGHSSTVEGLIRCGANVNAVDKVSYYVLITLHHLFVLICRDTVLHYMMLIIWSQFNSGEFSQMWSKC